MGYHLSNFIRFCHISCPSKCPKSESDLCGVKGGGRTKPSCVFCKAPLAPWRGGGSFPALSRAPAKKGDTPMCRAGSGSCGAPAPAGAPSTGAAGAAAAPFPQGGPAPCFEGKPSQNTKTKGHPFGMSLRFFGTARGQGAPCCARPVQKGFFLFLRQGQLLSGENQGGV